MSPEVEAALIGGATGGLVGGLFALLGALLGLFGEPWVRSGGEVRHTIDWRHGRSAVDASRSDGVEVQERLLRVTFLNRKEVPVTVWDMRLEFYKKGKPLSEGERPLIEFVDESDQTSPVGPVDLPSHVTITRRLIVEPGTPTLPNVPVSSPDPDKLRAVQEADGVKFVAIMVGRRVRNISHDLPLWQDTKPYHKTESSRSRWRFSR